MKSLYGEQIPDLPPILERIPHGKYIDWKLDNKYRKAEYPGLGICCKTCVNKLSVHGGSKSYYKCSIMGVSASTASDIRLRNVCDKWERKNEQENRKEKVQDR